MKKIICLNSGGLDSTVLLHDLRHKNPDATIYSLFFEYGQNNLREEFVCAGNNAKKLGCIFVSIPLPCFNWTSLGFYNSEYTDNPTQYLEYRNLVFIAYAMSFAESVGAKEIYMAILKSHGYLDTSEKFYTLFYRFAWGMSNILVRTPYSKLEKENLALIAFSLGIEPDTYFSCNTPVDGKPCGKCPDCLTLKDVKDYLTINSPFKQYAREGDVRSPAFKKLFMENKITEVRLLLNNKCQLSCPHCFYGFSEPSSEVLPREDMLSALKKFIDLGVTNVHFAGKEPLINDDFIWYVQQIQGYNPSVTWDVVTNGLTIPKYVKKLKELSVKRVCLSVDSPFEGDKLRSTFTQATKAINLLNKAGIPVQVFIDLHEGNIEYLMPTIRLLYTKFGVRDVYIRTIRRVGKAKDMEEIPLPLFLQAYDSLSALSELPDIHVTFNIGRDYVNRVMRSGIDSTLLNDIKTVVKYGTVAVDDNLRILPEFYCCRFENTVTLTPDGYVLGCGCGVSVPNYSQHSAGNIAHDSVEDIIATGKKIGLKGILEMNRKSCENCFYFYK
jgi:7-cyano-7-deazaguanine synthase